MTIDEFDKCKVEVGVWVGAGVNSCNKDIHDIQNIHKINKSHDFLKFDEYQG